ncbi:ABC-type microcin C transport system permease subunit YejB [Herbaspirillum sp. Sphag1AN]|uniref:hypothetical protein n=1 Tax=unclassified Herbaspirillum TaxID=2624150 RepID=UPI00184CCB5B|nr:ABC-type microcin C transport system permease subunit YejB [Herbaspirillum sp. Sphag1AN]MBB3245567.1 ABC-type microcin C transport system permease subunit YejB [Herbaspirillum sp. Sphag64]
MKLRNRIILLCIPTLLGIIILSLVSLNSLRNTLLEQRKAELTVLVTLAKAAMEKTYALEQSGQLTHEQALA